MFEDEKTLSMTRGDFKFCFSLDLLKTERLVPDAPIEFMLAYTIEIVHSS